MSMTELASRMSTIGISHHRRTAQKKLTSSVAMSSRARTLAIIGSSSASDQDNEEVSLAALGQDPTGLGQVVIDAAPRIVPLEEALGRTRFVELTDSVGYLVDTLRAHGLPPQCTILVLVPTTAEFPTGSRKARPDPVNPSLPGVVSCGTNGIGSVGIRGRSGECCSRVGGS